MWYNKSKMGLEIVGQWFRALPAIIQIIIGVPIFMLAMAFMAFILTELPAVAWGIVRHYWDAFMQAYRGD